MSDSTVYSDACKFCKIARSAEKGVRVMVTEKSCAILALPQPLSGGHTLILPKRHAAKMHELPDDDLADIIKVAKKVAIKLGFEEYNILQNNGKLAKQTIHHVHFHVINKPDEKSGLALTFPDQLSTDDAEKSRANIFNEAQRIKEGSMGDGSTVEWSREELEEFHQNLFSKPKPRP